MSAFLSDRAPTVPFPARVKWVVFDFDGTMADSKAVFLSTYNQVAARHGFKIIETGEVENLRALTMQERSKWLQVPLYRLPFLAMEFYGLYKLKLSEVLLVEGLPTLLRELKSRGYSLAVISSNAKANITAFLQANSLSFIDEIYCSSNIFGKHFLIRRFLRENKLKQEQMLYVGDEVRDIVACRRVGVKIVWVGWGYDLSEVARQAYPDFMVESPEEILALLAQPPYTAPTAN